MILNYVNTEQMFVVDGVTEECKWWVI